jgi:O-antigen ligase/tetratricopeptide (TPR) repeat protein
LEFLSTDSKASRILDRLQDLCLVAILLAAPLVFYTHGFDVFEFNKMMAVRILCAVAALAFLAQKLFVRPLAVRRSVLDWPLLAFLAASLVSTFHTYNPILSIHGVYEDFEGIVTLLMYFFLCWWTLQRGGDARRVRAFTGAVILAGTVAGFYGILQNFQIDFVPWNPATYSKNRLFATMGNPDFLIAYLIMSLPFCLVAFLEVPERMSTDRGLCAVLILLGALASYGLIALFNIDYFNFNPSLYGATSTAGMMLSQKFLAAHLIVFFPLATAVLLFFGRLKPIFLISMLFQVVAMAYTKSRGGTLGLAAGMVILGGILAWEWRKGTELFRHNRWWLGSFALLTLATILFYPPVRETTAETLQRLAALTNPRHVTLTPRLYIWRAALQMLKDHPLFGIGLDNFQIVFPRYRTALYWNLEWNGTPEKAHNVVMQTAATMGAVGLGTWLWLLAAFAFAGWKVLKSAPSSSQRLAAGACLASVLAFLVQDLFSFTVVGYGSLFWMLLGLVPALPDAWKEPSPAKAPDRRADVPLWSIPAFGLAAVLMLVFTWHSTKTWVADSFYKQGQVGMNAGQPAYALAMMQKAAGRLGPLTQDDLQKVMQAAPSKVPVQPGLNPDQELYWVKLGIGYEAAAMVQTTPENKERAFLAALAIHQHTVEMNPLNGYNYNNKGRVLKSMGESLNRPEYLRQAEAHYREAIRLDPNNVYFNLDLAQTLIDLGKLEEGLTVAKELQEKFPDFALPYSYAGLIEGKLGRKKEAIADLSKALASDWKTDGSSRPATEAVLKQLKGSK